MSSVGEGNLVTLGKAKIEKLILESGEEYDVNASEAEIGEIEIVEKPAVTASAKHIRKTPKLIIGNNKNASNMNIMAYSGCYISGTASIHSITVKSAVSMYVETIVENMNIESNNAKISLNNAIGTLNISGKNTELAVNAKITKAIISEESNNIILNSTAVIAEVTIKASKTVIEGNGKIEELTVEAEETVIKAAVTYVIVLETVKSAVIGGQTVEGGSEKKDIPAIGGQVDKDVVDIVENSGTSNENTNNNINQGSNSTGGIISGGSGTGGNTNTGGNTTTGSAVTIDYSLSLKPDKMMLNANNIDNTNIGILLTTSANDKINKDMAVGVQIDLNSSTVGKLSQKSITLVYNEEQKGWYGAVNFTPAVLEEESKVTISAKVFSAINCLDSTNLIGISSEPVEITLVPSNTEKMPNFTVTTQSPEQYKVTFNTKIKELENFAVGEEISPDIIGLQFCFKDQTIDTVDSPIKQTAAMTEWADIRKENKINEEGKRTGLGQSIKVLKIEDDIDGRPQIKVEVNIDWTQLSNYKINGKNYFDYSFAIRFLKGTLTNAVNGIKNTDMIKNINAITRDTTAPTISDITLMKKDTSNNVPASPSSPISPSGIFNNSNEFIKNSEKASTEYKYKIKFSEPIQGKNRALADSVNGYYAHAYTPSAKYNEETKTWETVEPDELIVEFYDKNTKITYPMEVTGWADLEDTSIYVRTQEASFPMDHDFIVRVKNISDDVGNISDILEKELLVDHTIVPSNDFQVLSVLIDANYDSSGKEIPNITSAGAININSDESKGGKVDLEGIDSEGKEIFYGPKWLDPVLEGQTDAMDAVYIEFSKGFQAAPIQNSALNTQNWKINGNPLPVGTYIITGIRGTNLINGRSGITIILPDGTLKDINNTLVNICGSIKDLDETVLSGKTEFTTQTIFTGSIFDGTGDIYEKLTDNTYQCINYDKTGIENK